MLTVIMLMFAGVTLSVKLVVDPSPVNESTVTLILGNDAEALAQLLVLLVYMYVIPLIVEI